MPLDDRLRIQHMAEVKRGDQKGAPAEPAKPLR